MDAFNTMLAAIDAGKLDARKAVEMLQGYVSDADMQQCVEDNEIEAE